LGERRGVYRVLVGKPEGKIWLRIRAGGGRGNEPSGSIKCWEFLD
jgi:hypothetical protein